MNVAFESELSSFYGWLDRLIKGIRGEARIVRREQARAQEEIDKMWRTFDQVVARQVAADLKMIKKYGNGGPMCAHVDGALIDYETITGEKPGED